jgi:hypothetical protein
VPTIEANTGIVTQINVFTVPEGGQQALIDFLTEAARFASTTTAQWPPSPRNRRWVIASVGDDRPRMQW